VTFARSFAVVMLIALVFTVAPGGGSALNVVTTMLSIAFFTAIALFGYRLYRENQFTLDSLTEKQRLVLYGSIAGALLTFTATPRLFDSGGLGVMTWLVLLGLFSYGVMWVYTSYRSYG
jgi:Kef-type K+ transport system membrane component KefB